MLGPDEDEGYDRDTDPIRRTRLCGFARLSSTVAVQREREDGRTRFGGLLTCGSIHACPVCSANIRHQRMIEIEQGCMEWLARGGSLVMVTLTTRHQAGMALDGLWDAVAQGWRSAMGSGRHRTAAVERWGLVGFIRTVEVTHGRNGWHPHVHALLFVQGDPDVIADQVAADWFPRWASTCERLTGQRPDPRYGIRVVPVTESSVGQYLAKVQDGEDEAGGWSPAHEIARGDLKRSRGQHGLTPFGLLAAWQDENDPGALRAWREWERTSKGRRVIEWSRASKNGPALRDLLGVDVIEDQAAADRRAYEVDPVYFLTPTEWDLLTSTRLEVQVLELAATDGTEGVVRLLMALFGLNGTGQGLACRSCDWTDDGLRWRSCKTCEDRLQAAMTERTRSWG